jgi:DNA-directed RNA polymerase specialized sigma subunit
MSETGREMPGMRADILKDLAALRGFVTPGEVAQFEASEGRPDLPVWEDGQEDAPAAVDLDVPGGGPPLKRALDASGERGFNREKNDALLLKLEVLEALAIGVALAGEHGAEMVEAFVADASRCGGEGVPTALLGSVAATVAPLLDGDAHSSVRMSRVSARLLTLLRSSPGGMGRLMRSRLLSFIRHVWLPDHEGECDGDPWLRFFLDFAAEAEEVRCTVWADNLRIAVWGMYRSGVSVREPDKLLVAAADGLDRTLDSFDAQRGTLLTTYGFQWVRSQVQREWMNTAHVLRLPAYQWEEKTKIWRSEIEFRLKEGCVPSGAELADAVELDEPTLAKKLASQRPGVPAGVRWLADGGEAVDLALARDQMTLADLEWGALVRQALGELALQLTDREHYVLSRRFGLDNSEPASLETIGGEMGVTRERIRQIETKALERIRGTSRELLAQWHRLYGYEPTPSTPPTS